MKMKLAAVGALALCTLTAQAADVRMYGIIDTGIIVERNHMGTKDASTYAREEFGINLGPRVGLIADENLGDDLKFHMVLENLFESDNGAMRFNRLFGGESSAALIGSFGEVVLGRMGALTSPFGHWGVFGMQATPFGFGWGRAGGVHWMVGGDRLDNTVSWASPKMGDVTVYAQYSFQTGSNPIAGVEEVHTADNNRRASMAVKYQTPRVTVVGTVDQIFHPSPSTKTSWAGEKDTQIASLTTNFLVTDDVRLYVMGQVFKNYYTVPGTPVYSPKGLIGAANLAADNQDGISGRGFDGYVLGVSAKIKAWGGDLLLTAAYDDFDYKGNVKAGQETNLKRYMCGVAYEYPVSKHTHLYASANVTHGKGLFDSKNFSGSDDPNSEQVMFGLTHFF